MTKEKVEKLEIDVAIIQNDIGALKEDAKSMKNLLKWFIVLCAGIILSIVVQIWNSAGNTKLMQSNIQHNQNIIRDMASQGIQKGWYKPSENVFRNGKKDKS